MTDREVVVTDIEIPFWSMVTLLVKLAIAAIPAIIILGTLITLFSMLLGALFGIDWGFHMGRGTTHL